MKIKIEQNRTQTTKGKKEVGGKYFPLSASWDNCF
jgi:hypothetical protein